MVQNRPGRPGTVLHIAYWALAPAVTLLIAVPLILARAEQTARGIAEAERDAAIAKSRKIAEAERDAAIAESREIARLEREAAIAGAQRLLTAEREEYLRAITLNGMKLERQVKEAAKIDENDGSILIGDLLVCWGRADLTPDFAPPPNNSPHTRTFKFRFLREFAFKPVVTTGFDETTSGYVYGVFDSSLNTESFSGRVFDNRSAPGALSDEKWQKIRVAMSYVAIGKAKSASPTK
jgi:hypothetical protein